MLHSYHRPVPRLRPPDRQLLGTTNRPAVMPMDAWREGDRFVIELDLPGVSRDSIDLDVERNVLTVRAERVARNGDWEALGRLSVRVVPSAGSSCWATTSTSSSIEADLRRRRAAPARCPVAEKAKPRRIEIGSRLTEARRARSKR